MIFAFKLLFGFIGFKLALWMHVTPLGGVIVGVLVGHAVDYAATTRYYQWRAKRYYQAQAKQQFDLAFLDNLFAMFGYICACDGGVAKSEVDAVEKIIRQTLKLKKKAKNRAITAFNGAVASPAFFQSSAVRYFELYHNQPQILETTIQLFLDLAAADGHVNEAENSLISTAASIFGIAPARYRQMSAAHLSKKQTQQSQASADRRSASGARQSKTSGKQGQEHKVEPMYDHSLTEAYATLGCEPNASVEEIKKCYRKLVLDYHPDTIHSKGLPEDFVKFANSKFNSIQEAYEKVKSARGIS